MFLIPMLAALPLLRPASDVARIAYRDETTGVTFRVEGTVLRPCTHEGGRLSLEDDSGAVSLLEHKCWPELGAFKSDRTPYPVAHALSKFTSFILSLPFKALPPAKADCVIIVRDSEMVNSTYVLARQAGLQPRFADPTKRLPDSRVYFLPDAKGRAFLTLRRWDELKARVRDEGATLAIEWNDTFLPDHEEVFGAEIESRTPGRPVFRPIAAEALETDKSGNPCFMRNRYGKGTVYLLTRPVSALANKKTGGFESDAWRYYATACPKKLLVEDGARDVTVSEHPFADGTVAVILVNKSSRPHSSKPAIASGWTVAGSLTDDASAAGWKDGALRLDGNAGILLMLRKGDR